MGKLLQFHRKVELRRFKAKRIKPFHNELTNRNQNYLFMKLKQFKRENSWNKDNSSSEQEHRANALASGAEEGRDKLRKAAGSCK